VIGKNRDRAHHFFIFTMCRHFYGRKVLHIYEISLLFHS
jgi:hypothetical protein